MKPYGLGVIFGFTLETLLLIPLLEKPFGVRHGLWTKLCLLLHLPGLQLGTALGESRAFGVIISATVNCIFFVSFFVFLIAAHGGPKPR